MATKTAKKIEKAILSELSSDIIKILAYYDIFSYPLTLKEIYFSSSLNNSNIDDIGDKIEHLISLGIIYKLYDFYSLQNDMEIVNRRLAGNKLAIKKNRTANYFSSVISKFPYVRSVLVSGSLSKGYMDEKSDIDFFIITEPNKLWISRFLLMLFKKIFLLNSKKNFCINYLITSDNLEIEEKNIYTAVELATLMPTYGIDYYELLCSKNQWVRDHLPNHPFRKSNKIKTHRASLIQKIIEPLFNNKFGSKIDESCMTLFYKYDKKKYFNYDDNSFKSSFKIRKNIATHHPTQFQNKVLFALKQKIMNLQIEHNIKLELR